MVKKNPDIHRDKNFDDLASKFKRKVYGNLKGRIRLAVLKADLKEFFPRSLESNSDNPLHILDAGSGYGPFSLTLAQTGHKVTLVDHSIKMLDLARELIKEKGINASQVNAIHSSIQKIPESKNASYDMVLCHAVLEWVHDPVGLIEHLVRLVKPSGIISLTFYNLNGMIYKNLLRTNYKKILTKSYTGWPGSLTPTHPLTPEQVLVWLEKQPVNILCHSGIRVFYDFILDIKDQKRHPDTVVELELELSRKPPFRELGRYQHILVQKNGIKS